mgnify:CR=1 FL=1
MEVLRDGASSIYGTDAVAGVINYITKRDFVGTQCETNSGCYERSDPRQLAFYDKVSNGQCCVMLFPDDGNFLDPGYAEIPEDSTECVQQDPVVPIKKDCPEDQENVTCRRLPKSVLDRPGVVNMPAGCTEVGEPLTLDSPSIKGDEDKLYTFMCLMPQLDSDFDGIGDTCDLCEFSFDPDNSFYKDDNNKVWPNYGKYCKGKYDPEKEQSTCEDISGDTDTDTDTDTELAADRPPDHFQRDCYIREFARSQDLCCI